MEVKSLIEQLLFSTVRITTIRSEGEGLGTGFFYETVDSSGRIEVWVVTNKHVIADAKGVTLHFIAKDDQGFPVLGTEVAMGFQASSFKGHPDPDIDIAVTRIGEVLLYLHSIGKPVYFRSIAGATHAATPAVLQDFEPIEPVMFIGYPNNLYDSASLLPIVRRGHSATALSVDYEGKPIFLIDASVFPGSSGSPVFLVAPASTPDKRGNIRIGGGPRFVFLGVVAAVYEQEVPVLDSSGGTGFVQSALDIGVVYKAAAVAEAIEQYS